MLRVPWIAGRQSLVRPLLRCGGCGKQRRQDKWDLLQLGVFPLAPQRPSVFVHISIFEEWRFTQAKVPRMGLGSFLEALAQRGLAYGGDATVRNRAMPCLAGRSARDGQTVGRAGGLAGSRAGGRAGGRIPRGLCPRACPRARAGQRAHARSGMRARARTHACTHLQLT